MIKWILKKAGYMSMKEHQRRLDSLKNPYNGGTLYDHVKVKRRSGNTTRAIDLAIQELFLRRHVSFTDHHKTPENMRRVLNMTLYRLQVEHGIRREDLVHSVKGNKINISFKKR